jgi:hypothetical protein
MVHHCGEAYFVTLSCWYHIPKPLDAVFCYLLLLSYCRLGCSLMFSFLFVSTGSCLSRSEEQQDTSQCASSFIGYLLQFCDVCNILVFMGFEDDLQ